MNFDADLNDFKYRLREVIGKNTSSFADKCGIGESTIRSYLNGSFPRLDKLVTIATTANVTVEFLATGKGPKTYQELGNTRGNGNHVNQLEDPLIKDLKIWLRDMTTEEPEWRTWFEIELARKIPEFAEWRKKNKDDDSLQKDMA